MSVSVMSDVWTLDLPSHLKLTLLGLADHANDDGKQCFPSIDRLAWKSGQSRRTIQRHLRELEDRGIVTCQRSSGGRGNPSKYQIHPEKGDRLSPFNAEKGDTDDVKGDTGVTQTVSRTVSKNKHTNGDSPPDDESDPVRNWMHPIFIDELGGDKPHPKLTTKRDKKMTALHEEHLVDAEEPKRLWRALLKTLKASDYHMSERSYQMPESFLRNEERRDRWIQKGHDYLYKSGQHRLTVADKLALREERMDGD